MSDSSDSEIDTSSKMKTKKSTVFDNNVFDAEESDEKTKSINRKNKINQQQFQQTKKSILKTNNEQIKKEKLTKINDEQPIITKKKITIPKIVDKKKFTINSTKSTSKTTIQPQKRPSTDESNESTKKLKLDDEKSKSISIEEQIPSITIQTESEISTSNKPSIVITSPTTESSINLPKIDEPPPETNPQITPTKFGIVFPSHHRHSTTTPPSSSIRTQSTETSTSHETSKNDDEEMDEDNESVPIINNNNNNNNNNNTINKNEQISLNTNTLKPPTTTQPPLSDDETLNPETMQLSDLIGATRREGTKSVQSRSTNKTTGKGKRTAKQDTSNKRQQTKANSKTIQSTISKDKESEPATDSTLISSTEQTPLISTNTKRLSITESSSISSPNNDKEAKRLRKSTDDSTSQSQVKLEPIENLSKWTNNTQVKEEAIEPTLSSGINKPDVRTSTSSTSEQSQITSMETDQIPSSTSIITSTNSPSTKSTETENAIKALYSTIQIPQQSISKTPNLEKSSPIIAPISKETLHIVEHQPTSIQKPSILPSHVSIKSSLTSATFSMFFFKYFNIF